MRNTAGILILFKLAQGAYGVQDVIEKVRLNFVLLHRKLCPEFLFVYRIKACNELLYSVKHTVEAL